MSVKPLLFLIIVGFVNEAAALHKPDHRYAVSGYVRDETGQPKPNTKVVITHKGGQQQKAKTDSYGYFETVFHLHNDNLGDELTVTAGSEVKKITVTFDPEDLTSSRGGRVDFGAPAKEASGKWLYWGGGALLVGAVLYFSMIKKKKKVKQRKKK